MVANSRYFTLLTANVGAVIMPWMIFYQQEAVIDKGRRGLGPRDALRSARLDTATGAVLTQAIMIAIVVASADHPGTLKRLKAADKVAQPLLVDHWLPMHPGAFSFDRMGKR